MKKLNSATTLSLLVLMFGTACNYSEMQQWVNFSDYSAPMMKTSEDKMPNDPGSTHLIFEIKENKSVIDQIAWDREFSV